MYLKLKKKIEVKFSKNVRKNYKLKINAKTWCQTHLCVFVILQTELVYLCDVVKKFVIVTYSIGHSKESLVTELQYLFLHPSLFPSRIKCQIACPFQILEDWSLKLSKGSHALSLFNEWYLLLMVVGLVFSLHHVDVESSWTSTCLACSHTL